MIYMVKSLNRTVRNDICFVYKTPASEQAGLKANDEIRVIEVKPDGSYLISSDGKKIELTRVQAKLVMVYE